MCLEVHKLFLGLENRYGNINDYSIFLYWCTFIYAFVFIRKYSFKYWVQLTKKKKKKTHKWSTDAVNKNRICNAVQPCGLPGKNLFLLWWVEKSAVTIMLLEMNTKFCSPVFNWQYPGAFRDKMQVLCYNSSHDCCGSIIYLHKTPMTSSVLLSLWVKYDVLAIRFGDSLTMAMYT